jgi:hypothetical protein
LLSHRQGCFFAQTPGENIFHISERRKIFFLLFPSPTAFWVIMQKGRVKPIVQQTALKASYPGLPIFPWPSAPPLHLSLTHQFPLLEQEPLELPGYERSRGLMECRDTGGLGPQFLPTCTEILNIIPSAVATLIASCLAVWPTLNLRTQLPHALKGSYESCLPYNISMTAFQLLSTFCAEFSQLLLKDYLYDLAEII